MRTTGIVLWLMILLVFVPIGAAHGIALFLEKGDHPEIASVEDAGSQRVVTR
ncbi:hypothetical protein [Enterovirga aerilata]|uniref:Uncharacterized protein n=1 Tax=Enterovirga aerilata TaxID=2730920 RepID=A0A849IFC8_9HYPH|nr:hypothetical protein [Enterovirga sp. DB1703]NNM72603.1 hypothetical protein [Enterovirga sp. DB1703]